MDDISGYLLLFLAGAISSFINMMAGGGSLLTIGLMIMLGIEPSVANGTNRIGVLFGTGSGALAFRTSKFSDLRQSLILAASAIPGAIIGSFYSIQLADDTFQKILALVMIGVLITMFIPKKKKPINVKDSFWIYPAMVGIGFYGGFIQVGVGFILMAALRHLLSLDLLRTNMHKVFVVLIYTLPVLLIFGLNGKIDWFVAIVLSAGTSTGAWLSVKQAIRKGERLVRIVLAVSIVLMSVKLLFF